MEPPFLSLIPLFRTTGGGMSRRRVCHPEPVAGADDGFVADDELLLKDIDIEGLQTTNYNPQRLQATARDRERPVEPADLRPGDLS